MAEPPYIRQIGARHLNSAVTVMAWNNKMDLMAYGTEKGEIVIQRLNWQKVFTLPAPEENVQVRSISWQQNATVLAVGYSNGQLSLVDVEREQVIIKFKYESDLKKAYFSRIIKTDESSQIYSKTSELSHECFLPFLPKLNNLGVTSKVCDIKTFAKDDPCFLVVILKNGRVHLRLLVSLEVGILDTSIHVQNPDNFEVIDVQFNGKFNYVYVIVRDGNIVKLLRFKNAVFNENIVPMTRLAVQCALINDTKKYIDNTIQCVLEAWETVLLEMDNKLTQYANEQPANALSADFLELLVFGYASNDVEDFLTRELTDKEVKKLQTSIDLSYSTIQALVSKPLHLAGINMFYFLSTVKGLARNTYFYEPLLDYVDAESALQESGSFIMKVQEMRQVVDESVKTMKLFFSWLHLLIIRLTHDDMGENLTQLNTAEIMYLAEYLHSFKDTVLYKDGTVFRKKFNLEKVGQYFDDHSLRQTVSYDFNDPWQQLLLENTCITKSKLVFPLKSHTSLIQQQNSLFEAISKVFSKCTKSVSESFELDTVLKCADLNRINPSDCEQIRCSFITCDEIRNIDLWAISVDCKNCLIIEFNRKFTQASCVLMDLRMEKNCPGISSLIKSFRYFSVIDLHFYNEELLSILIKSTETAGRLCNYFVQIPLYSLPNESKRFGLPQSLDLVENSELCCLSDHVNSNEIHKIHGNCTDLAVSGSRKVASVLSDNRRKLTIFELEIDENDDDMDITQNNSHDLST